ncbi:DUF2785 domain-containing protein [Yimella sp. cx-51]|uniref:DUF2785 domain-containing protein n=1 Tax=Yimella sp. cx-51 TaxID=2770551 RepID=UPI00165DFC95|nr:DUF2785 domain-containing protein [Yimella sp. cx-51]QTH38883.1 DUF2785 domain-containing protein [Yimella sp. cx-51]
MVRARGDTRGYDDELGWLHAVAHGADFLGSSAKVGAATPSEVLQPIAYRLVHD